MTVAVVQLTATGDSAVLSATVAAPVTNVPTIANHLLLVGRAGAKLTVTSVSDGVNTWQIDKTVTGSTLTQGHVLASCKVTGSLSGGTITATWSAGTSNRKQLYIIEVSGLHPTAWFDAATALFEGTTATTRTTSNSISPTTIGDLIVGQWGLGTTNTGQTATSPFTVWPTATGAGYFNGTNGALEGVYLVTTGAGAQTPASTGNASFAYGGWAATYKQAPAASTLGRRVPDRGLVMRAVISRPKWMRRNGIWLPDRTILVPA